MAVLVALVAIGVAGWAVHRANVAVAATEKLGTGPQPAAVQPTADVPTTDPVPTEGAPTASTTESSPGAATTIDPEAEFTTAYEGVGLNVQVRSGARRTIDLDKPRVDGDPDVALEGGQQATTMSLDSGVTAAMAETTDVTPKQCINNIGLSALDPTGEFPLRKGQVYCVQTSQADAQAKGESQKIVVIAVAGISDEDVVSLKATAYYVPS
jgi:hypothetical protein